MPPLEYRDRSEHEERKYHVPVVSVVPLKAARPEHIFYEEFVPISDLWLTRADLIKKSAMARNPMEIMPLHGQITGADPMKDALRELRDELQIPIFHFGAEPPYIRRYTASLGDFSVISREEHLMCVYCYDIIDPVGVNPVDKIEHPVSLDPVELEDLFTRNEYGPEGAPLLTSLIYSPEEENPLHPMVDADPESVLAARNYITDSAYWFEARTRARAVSELFRMYPEYLSSVNAQDLNQLLFVVNITSGSLDQARDLLFTEDSPGDEDPGWRGDPIEILGYITDLMVKLDERSPNPYTLMQDYRAAYSNMYFRDILDIPSDDTQKPFVDAVAILSSETITPELLEQLGNRNHFLFRLLTEVANSLDVPYYEDPHFFTDLQNRLTEIFAEPYKRSMASAELKTRLFGNELNYTQYQDDAILLIEQMSEVFRQLYADETEFHEDFDLSYLRDEDPLILFGKAFQIPGAGQVEGNVMRFQILRHLTLMLYAQELYPIYSQMRGRRPPQWNTVQQILREHKAMIPTSYEPVQVRMTGEPKSFSSFFRKVIERTPPRKINDVHRYTGYALTDIAEDGTESVFWVAREMVARHVQKGDRIRIQNIKMHKSFMPFIEAWKDEFGSAVDIDFEHIGSLATGETMSDVLWGKFVIVVNDTPMEFAMAARAQDLDAKYTDDADFQLRRLFTMGNDRLSLVDALFSLQPQLREKMLYYFHNRGMRFFDTPSG